MVGTSIKDARLVMLDRSSGGGAFGEAFDEVDVVGAMIIDVSGDGVVRLATGAPERETFLIQFGMCGGLGFWLGLSRLALGELGKFTGEPWR